MSPSVSSEVLLSSIEQDWYDVLSFVDGRYRSRDEHSYASHVMSMRHSHDLNCSTQYGIIRSV